MSRVAALALFLVALFAAAPVARAADEPRTVLFLTEADSNALALAAPKLMLLGLIAEPHDAAAPLPSLTGRADIRGIVVWLETGDVGDPDFIGWVRRAIEMKLPVVMMGKPPIVEDRFGLFLSLGLLYGVDDRAFTYDMRVVERDDELIGYERDFDRLFPVTPIMRPLDAPLSRSLLVLERRGNAADRTHPLIVTDKGAFAADGYTVWSEPDGKRHRWLVDPVAWFRLALHIETMPVPDLTTLNGRRIFAPSIVPANQGDGDAATLAALALSRTRGLVLPVRAHGDVPEINICGTRLGTRLTGFGGGLAALSEDGSSRRTAAFAPRIGVCADGREFEPLAGDAVFAAARALPLTVQRDDGAKMAADFASVRMVRLPGTAWRTERRGSIQTIRFDEADVRLDWAASEGVLGGARTLGALYVALDPACKAPVVAVTRAPWTPPPWPVLVESRWTMRGLSRDGDRVTINVAGDGIGDMAWATQPGSQWEVRLVPKSGGLWRYRIAAGPDGLMSFSLPEMPGGTGLLELVRHAGDDAA